MRDEKFLSFDLSFSLQERVKTRERAISKTRDKISIDSKKQKKAKILPKRLLLLLFKEEQVSLFRSKIQKNSKRIFFTTDREKTTKKLEEEEVRWEGTRHITLLCY